MFTVKSGKPSKLHINMNAIWSRSKLCIRSGDRVFQRVFQSIVALLHCCCAVFPKFLLYLPRINENTKRNTCLGRPIDFEKDSSNSITLKMPTMVCNNNKPKRSRWIPVTDWITFRASVGWAHLRVTPQEAQNFNHGM